jgi:hypothetical protein
VSLGNSNATSTLTIPAINHSPASGGNAFAPVYRLVELRNGCFGLSPVVVPADNELKLKILDRRPNRSKASAQSLEVTFCCEIVTQIVRLALVASVPATLMRFTGKSSQARSNAVDVRAEIPGDSQVCQPSSRASAAAEFQMNRAGTGCPVGFDEVYSQRIGAGLPS